MLLLFIGYWRSIKNNKPHLVQSNKVILIVIRIYLLHILQPNRYSFPFLGTCQIIKSTFFSLFPPFSSIDHFSPALKMLTSNLASSSPAGTVRSAHYGHPRSSPAPRHASASPNRKKITEPGSAGVRPIQEVTEGPAPTPYRHEDNHVTKLHESNGKVHVDHKNGETDKQPPQAQQPVGVEPVPSKLSLPFPQDEEELIIPPLVIPPTIHDPPQPELPQLQIQFDSPQTTPQGYVFPSTRLNLH